MMSQNINLTVLVAATQENLAMYEAYQRKALQSNSSIILRN